MMGGSDHELARKILEVGDLAELTGQERQEYYLHECERLGLDPKSNPLAYFRYQGKLRLYVTRAATDQIRDNRKISVEIVSREFVRPDDETVVYCVYARASDGSRQDESLGAVSCNGLKGEHLANALMKAECVPTEYEILTRRGFLRHDDLVKGEEVLGLDSRTLEPEWATLTGVSCFENQKTVSLGNTGFQVECTPNHRWLSHQAGQDGDLSLRPLMDLNDLSMIKLAGGKPSGALGSVDVTDKEAAILGWLVTDGTIKYYRDEWPYRASICQCKTENFDLIEWALSDTPHSHAVTERSEPGWLDEHWWHLSHDVTTDLMKRVGFRTIDDIRDIPLRMNASQRVAMLTAMMAADADRKGNFAKTKPAVMDCFSILQVMMGHLISPRRSRMCTKSTKPIFLQKAYQHNQVKLGNLAILGSRRADVWCPTTSVGTWFCRTPEGQVFATGNSKAKRRVTLSICGAGHLDEVEIEDLPDADKLTPEDADGEQDRRKEAAVSEAKRAARERATEVAGKAEFVDDEAVARLWELVKKVRKGDDGKAKESFRKLLEAYKYSDSKRIKKRDYLNMVRDVEKEMAA